MWNAIGASIRGPQHRREGRPNQDAWLGRVSTTAALVVVCDGLGSRPSSAMGSRAACRAVADAARHWSCVPGAPPDLLLRAVHALWNIRVHAAGRDESATTCLFALATADSRLLLAQLGDGLVLLESDRGATALEPACDRFGNATTGLGIATDIREWRHHLEPRVMGRVSVLLATDGVADDLLPDKRAGFLDYLIARHGGRPAAARARSIAAELRAWPTPRHNDDKTVAVLWRHDTAEVPT